VKAAQAMPIFLAIRVTQFWGFAHGGGGGVVLATGTLIELTVTPLGNPPGLEIVADLNSLELPAGQLSCQVYVCGAVGLLLKK